MNRDRIGVVGMCGSGGFALSAAQLDRRIKAVATVVMYDIALIASEGWQGSLTAQEGPLPPRTHTAGPHHRQRGCVREPTAPH